jgi:hypothetical protein
MDKMIDEEKLLERITINAEIFGGKRLSAVDDWRRAHFGYAGSRRQPG